MNRYKRTERIGAITQILVNSPNKVFTLACFTEMFLSSKSTISEDIVILKETFESQKLGKIETITGAAGGVKYIPIVSKDKKRNIIESLVKELSKSERRLPGGYIYIGDILFNPKYCQQFGAIFAEAFIKSDIDYIVTVETKGIPLALMTAYSLDVPLVVFRKSFKADDGPTISIHYVSGSDGRLKTMYAPKNVMKKESNVLVIDGFMRAGGTAQGIKCLVEELSCKVVGVGILFDETINNDKLVDKYFSIFTLSPSKFSDNVQIKSDML